MVECYEKPHEDIRNHKFYIDDNSLKKLFKRYDEHINNLTNAGLYIEKDKLLDIYKRF